MIWTILATGPSLTLAQADSAYAAGKVIAISDAVRLAPWANALVSSDAAWWAFHKPKFGGRRFSAAKVEGAEQLEGVPSGTNSGALAIRVARHLGATRIHLFGYDGHGSHFFGPHPAGLKNTTESQRLVHAEQLRQEIAACRRDGIEIVNKTPDSAWRCFDLVAA